MKPLGEPARSLRADRLPTPITGTGVGQGSWANLALAACLAVAFLAISRQSYWIDEANAVWRAAEPDFASFLSRMVSDRGSDSQMPLFLGALWLWEKAFGTGEWVTRAMNLGFFLPGLVIFAAGRLERLAVASVSAFVWFYLDEARPYGMQIGMSLLVFGLFERAFIASLRGDGALLQPHETWLLTLGLVLLSGSTLLGAIFVAAAIAAAVGSIHWTPERLRQSRLGGPGVVLLLLLAPLAGYYLWTIVQGAGGTRIASTDWRNVVFAAYELLGLAGLGPGRTELREVGFPAFAPYLLLLAALAACSLTVLMAGVLLVVRQAGWWLLLSIGLPIALALAFIFLAGSFLHWRVVGRHVAPVIAIVLALQAAGMVVLWGRPATRAIVVTFLVLSLASAASLRLAPRHAKDDYHSAAAVASHAMRSGQRVWWNADAFGAMIYGLQLDDGCAGVRIISEPAQGFATDASAPAMVITSKPDIYDPKGALAAYLEEAGYRQARTFMAFVIWTSPDPAVGRCP